VGSKLASHHLTKNNVVLCCSLRAIMPGTRPRFIFACFKRIERCGDWLTGAAGPFFVAAATLLFVLGTLSFRMSLIFFKPSFKNFPNKKKVSRLIVF
jgi:hypothetical protein